MNSDGFVVCSLITSRLMTYHYRSEKMRPRALQTGPLIESMPDSFVARISVTYRSIDQIAGIADIGLVQISSA
jgi:hypothetical protein